MKKDIILAGVGGQGILSIAASIGMAAVNQKLYLKQAEVHGMSQRGGDVHSNLRISDKEIASDLIPEGQADMILSVEPMEALRYLPMLSADGWLITNSNAHKNIPNYPDIEEILQEVKKVKKHVVIDANKIAAEIGSRKSANIVILGAAAPFLGLEYKALEKSVESIFRRKGKEVVDTNLTALRKGFDFANNFIKN